MFTSQINPNNPIDNSSELSIVSLSQQEQRIVSAYRRGLYKPYEEFLKKSAGWNRPTMMDRIVKLMEGKSADKDNGKDFAFLYLATIAIDPDISENDKPQLINDYLNPLEAESLKELLYHIGHDDAALSIHIMKHGPQNFLEKVYQSILKYRSIDIYEKYIVQWIKATLDNLWTLEEKQSFLDRIFETLPQQIGNDCLYYFFNNGGEKLIESLTKVCSKNLAERIEALRNEVVQFGTTKLEQLKSKPERVRVSYTDNQRKFFLEWFYTHALNHELAELFALEFDEKDWNWLSEKISKGKGYSYESKPKLAMLAMKWVVSISQKLGANTLANESTAKSHDSGIWLFYHYASKFIEKEKGWDEISENDYKLLSQALNAETIYQFLSAFDEKWQRFILANWIQHEPQKLLALVDLIIKAPEDNRDGTADRISKLFELFQKSSILDKAITVLYNSNQRNCAREVTLYSSLFDEHRKAVLKHVLQDRTAGMQTLFEWIQAFLDPQKMLKPFVKDAFEKKFYQYLNELDPTLAAELKERLTPCLASSLEGSEFLDDLLPVGIDLNDPLVRRQRAFNKLKKHFQTPGIPYQERQKFVRNLYKDLKNEDNPSGTVNQLFLQLPKEIWPLIVLHFEDDICQSPYNNYFEEKSRGGMFNKVRREIPPLLMKYRKENPMHDFASERLSGYASQTLSPNLGDALLWYGISRITGPFLNGGRPQNKGIQDPHDFIAIFAQTLVQIAGNPNLDDEECHAGSALRCIYQAACETNSIYMIIKRFIEIASPAQFIPVMNLFAKSCFFYNVENFKKLIAVSLEEARVDKISYIADSLKGSYERNSYKRRWAGTGDLESALWEEPILQYPGERGAVAKKLIKNMGIQFLDYLANYSGSGVLIIKSLKESDDFFCQKIFYKWLKRLCHATNPADVKLSIFQKICYSYEQAGYDISALMAHWKMKRFAPVIAQWYQQENIGPHLHYTFAGLTLLKLFNSEAFYPEIFKQAEMIFSQKQYGSFYDLEMILVNLERLGCKEQFLEKLFGENPGIVEKIKNFVEGKLADCLRQGASSFELITKLVPDWGERLANWVIEKIKEEKDQALEYGSEPSYHEITPVLNALSGFVVLEDWLQILQVAAGEEFREEMKQLIQLAKPKNNTDP